MSYCTEVPDGVRSVLTDCHATAVQGHLQAISVSRMWLCKLSTRDLQKRVLVQR